MSALEAKHVKLLDQEIKKVAEEKKKYKKMQSEYKRRMANLEQAEQEFDRRRDAEIENIQVMKEKAEKRMKRDKRVLDQQSRTLLSKIPSKKDREEIQQLEALVEKERANHKRKERTHKMNEDRLRRQLAEMAQKNEELKDETRRLEKRHLDALDAAARERAQMNNSANTNHHGRERHQQHPSGPVATAAPTATTTTPSVLESVGNMNKKNSETITMSKSNKMKKPNHNHNSSTLKKVGIGSKSNNPQQKNLVDEKHHNDGRVEKFFSDGRRKILYLNGTTKDVYSNSDTVIHFTNGDTKKAYGNGSVEYYYAEVDTWHTTHGNGIEVFHFPSGQIEAHFPNGTKEVLFPDGIAHRLTDPEGDEHQTIDPSNLCYVFSKPKPQISLIKT
jgi:centromere protein J